MRRFITFTLALAGIAQVSAEQRTDKIIMSGNPAGTQTVQIESTGMVRAEYSYNDRGRGDHIIATWKLDTAGVPIEYEGRGNDYMKAPIEERFELKDGRASWKNRSRSIPTTLPRIIGSVIRSLKASEISTVPLRNLNVRSNSIPSP